jgi:hypothetical protein
VGKPEGKRLQGTPRRRWMGSIRKDLVQLQLLIQCSPQRTPKWPSSEPHGATRQQATAKTNAKLSGYQIPSSQTKATELLYHYY